MPPVQVGGRLKVAASAFEQAAWSDGPPVPPGEVVEGPWIQGPPGQGPHGEAPSASDWPIRRVPIRRLLIANRGELVVRIAETCRGLGITPIALVSEDQGKAWWAQQLDERVALDGTYLDADAVLAAARLAHADAIHPGYGFLAESAQFADAVDAAGIGWVGPSGAAMRAVGDKAAGRRLAQSVGVPIVPGYDGDQADDLTLAQQAARIGYPVMVKPSAGGGGKGMHVARDESQLTQTLEQARREARTAFGHDRLILERLIERPRHVEVQVLVDQHGNAVHLGERDCSVQRRHQKVIEEAPSPAVDEALRRRLGEAAIRLLLAAGYTNAGTVEFLLDGEGNFSFLEVNARLQVEHPVTEAITGRDLVADQLRIAAGEPLGFGQGEVSWGGHAIEARLYAEDPWTDFLPTVGVVEAVAWPHGLGIRVDAGIGPHDRIGTRYDPMLAKIIRFAKDRSSAIDGLIAALDDTHVMGLTTNRTFLATLLEAPAFRTGQATTEFIADAWHPDGPPALDAAFELAAAAMLTAQERQGATELRDVPFPGFRLNARPRIRLRIGDEERTLTLPRPRRGPPPGTVSALRGRRDAGEPFLTIDLDGRAFDVSIAPAPTVDGAIRHVQTSALGTARVTAPMPGVVLQTRVAAGDSVEAGQVLVVLEAMKMENLVTAPSAARVERVAVETGQQVGRGDILVELR